MNILQAISEIPKMSDLKQLYTEDNPKAATYALDFTALEAYDAYTTFPIPE